MAARFWVGGTGTWNASNTTNWSATTGGAGGASVPTAADTVTIDANSGAGVVVTLGTGYNPTVTSVTLSAGTLDLGSSNLTMTTFAGSGTTARTLAFNTGALYITGSNTTIFTIGTDTNLTITGSRNVYFTYSGSTGTRTVVTAAAANRLTKYLNFYITAGSDIFAINSAAAGTGMVVGTIDYTGFSGSGTVKGYAIGNVTYSATATSPIRGNGNNGITITPASGATSVFDLKGISWTGPFTVNAQDGTGVVQVKQDIVGAAGGTTDALGLFQGTLDLATYNVNVNMAALSIGGSSTRAIYWGSTSTLSLSGNGGTVFFGSSLTNYTYTGTQPVCVFTYAGATGTRTLSGPTSGATVANAFDIAFTGNATDILALTGTHKNINFANFNGTVNNGARGAYGNITYANTATYVAGTGATTMLPPASTATNLTTNGVTTTFPLTINGQGNVNLVGAYVCNANSTNSTLTITSGNLLLNSANLDIYSISITGSAVRGIVQSTGNINLWSPTGTVVTGTVMTNFQNYGSLTFYALGNSTIAQTRNFTAGTGAYEGQAYSVDILTGAGTIGLTGTFNNITFQDTFTGNIGAADRTVFGNLTFSNSQAITTADPVKTGTTTFASYSNTQTFTTRNVAFNQSVAVNNPYGNVNIVGNITAANFNALSLTSGNLNLNGYTANFGTFGASNYSTRQLQFGGTGALVLTGNNASVLNIAIADFFSYTGTANVVATYTGTTGSRSFLLGSNSPAAATAALPLTITDARDGVTVAGQFDDLNVANVAGTWYAQNKTLYGDYNVGAAAAVIGTGLLTTFAGTNTTQAVNTSNVNLGESYNFAASNTTVTLNGGLVAADYITLTSGNVNLNGQTVTANSFTSTSGIQRRLTTGNAQITINGTGTSWNVLATNFTLNANTSNITLTTTTANRTFAGGESLTYGNITLQGNTTEGMSTLFTGNITLAGTLAGHIPADHEVIFTSGTTTTVNGWTLAGSAGNTLGLTSTGFTQHNLVLQSGTVTTDYLDITLSNASPAVGNVWYAGDNSKDFGQNNGWFFYSYVTVYNGDFFLVI